MKVKAKSLSAFAGCVGSLVLAGSAAADYTGLSYEIFAIDGEGTGDTWTARIYANFSSANDELHAVFGDATNGLSIDSSGGFWQSVYGGPTSTSINPAFYPVFPSLVYDSWVTIGLEDMTDNALSDIGIDWSGFEAGGAATTDNGTWFVTPDDAQALAGADMRVLVAQLTMNGHNSATMGTLNFQGSNADGSVYQALGESFYYELPAPGALALLGLAGLAGRRRRRA